MTTFDDREKSFETKFIHDKELAMRVNARRNRLLGQWTAEKLGKKGDEAEQYAVNLAVMQLDERRKDIVGRVIHDLTHAGITNITAKDVRIEMERLFIIAHEQVAGNAS